jgi:hypothetical protein
LLIKLKHLLAPDARSRSLWNKPGRRGFRFAYNARDHSTNIFIDAPALSSRLARG